MPDKTPERPQQVTYAGWAVIAGSVVLLVSAFQQVSTLHTLDTRHAVEQLIGESPTGLGIGVEEWLSMLKVIAMVCGGCAAATAILGWQALQRSRTARIVLLAVAVPLVLTGLATGPLSALAVAAAVVVLWLPSANAWFDPRPQGKMQAMSEAPPPSDPYGQPTPPPHPQPYGQQPQYGRAPQYPPYGGAPTSPQRRPGAVTAAGIVTIVLSALSALLGVVLALVGSSMGQDMMDELDKRGYDTGSFDVHDLEVGFAILGGVIALAGVGAIVAAIFVLRRSNAARVVLTVMSGLCIALSLIGITSGGSVITLGGAIAVIVLLYRRSSNAWFAARDGQFSPPQPPTYPPSTWPQG